MHIKYTFNGTDNRAFYHDFNGFYYRESRYCEG